jgi:hypothetical protein
VDLWLELCKHIAFSLAWICRHAHCIFAISFTGPYL